MYGKKWWKVYACIPYTDFDAVENKSGGKYLLVCILYTDFDAVENKSDGNYTVVSLSHMSRALDGTEKSKAQKLGHPMLVQPILSQKNQKSKFFNEQFFCNWPICIFPYVKLEAKWRKNGSLCAVNCLILIKTALNSLLNNIDMSQSL